ncbi:MAG TPA: DUF4783 domain-containing protein [Saprospiraceae bacterium]|nr:DUF4783 domain-containing protein [Saprospiraceae bacterium]MCC6689120.1 DUF4783 domain-containing protein [Saprospiraceae bacterium]HMW75844.1 DUF4783 domain-containing protein [Saprospiraceae bacterium]HMZ72209.1 DUF4783 domain-containing protein [Saprospiraceae bacterium]HNE64185.1 DUF4783 domain-containing protein [Saprospiraceae bacterium]
MMSRFLFMILMLCTITSKAEVADPIWDAVSDAFRNGNIRSVSGYFGKMVDLTIVNTENTETKDQAISSLETFLSKNKPTGFTQVHQGTSRGKESYYCIGELNTQNGKFRVYVYFKTVSTLTQIQEVRIDKV